MADTNPSDAEHPLDALLPDICQLIDAVRMEWQQQGSWSAWDQSVRDRIMDYNLAKLAASRRDPSLPIAKESFRCSACNGVGSIGRLGPCVACNGFGFVAAAITKPNAEPNIYRCDKCGRWTDETESCFIGDAKCPKAGPRE